MGTWWPIAGRRENNSGALANVGNNAYYWSSSYHSTYNSYNLNFNYNGNVNPSNANNRSNGFSVRCVQDFTVQNLFFTIKSQPELLSALRQGLDISSDQSN